MNRLFLVIVLFALISASGVGQEEVPVDTSRTDVRYTLHFAEGLRTKMLGNPDIAISHFQQCIGLSPDSGSAFYELGLLYSEKKDFSAATGYARNAWKSDNRNKWYGMLLIDCLMNQGNYLECVPVYKALQKIEPDTEEFITGEIDMLIQAGEEKEALSRLNKMPRKGDLARWAAVRKKEIHFSMDQFDKGAKALLDWLKENPDDFELRGILAESYAEKDLKDEALAQYVILKEQNPDNPAVSFSLGQFYFQSGKKDEALAEFLQGFRSTEVNPAIKIDIVRAFLTAQEKQDKLDAQVIRLIEVLYETDRGEPAVNNLYANYLYSEERMQEAEPIYRELTRTDPGNFLVWQNLLFILNQKLDYPEILAVSDSALSYFPGQGLFYLFKGMSATELKNYPVAIAALNKGLSIQGQNPELIKQFYLSLAESLFRNGNVDEAFRNYDKMLVLEPDNVLVLNNYSYYLALNDRELDKALEMITKCVRLEPENATFLDTWAWVLYRRKEYKAAMDAIEKAIRHATDSSGEVLEHYGDILFRNGRTEEARQAWIRASDKKEVSGEIAEKIRNGLK